MTPEIEQWEWPDWVPPKVREQVESFYVHHGGHAGWLRSAERNGAPALGSVVTLGDGFGPRPQPVTGRFVFAWNNIARLVMDDGTFRYTSFHPADLLQTPASTGGSDR
jgi:hypothetical protein